ncbi:hypothetical protein [Nocardioides sp. SLBN-35]|uniref:hypothetical protein n=1 Tax=Nocardioides sp. SLBN-35 TaxID=2768445 RepID=UPI001168D679|nr:hypothetical protein [Nocardioides sp. SLBN-35]TQK70397.1 hypothetical protein FBY23_2173 [Nocardioides sp. SLBN-35]
MTPALDASTAAAQRDHAARLRERLGLAEAPILSATGLWLLLAAVAESVTDPADRRALEDALGVPAVDATATVGALLADPHPAVGAALGGWVRPDLTLRAPVPGPVPVGPLPGQAALDAWAREHTRGLIPTFPAQVDARTLLLLASALVTEPRWRARLQADRDGRLLLDDGLQALVATEAAGVVALACPPTDDGIDVLSVIAAPGVAAADVWRAVDEVVAHRLGGGLAAGDRPSGPMADGHAWRVREVVESFAARQAPQDGAELWTSRLPAWKAYARHDLSAAPGVAEVGRVVAGLLPPEALREGIDLECVQAATATYDADGFRAAAVTALSVRAAGMPSYVERRVRRVELAFDRPHAVVAVARGGAWDGVPLFHAWVTMTA